MTALYPSRSYPSLWQIVVMVSSVALAANVADLIGWWHLSELDPALVYLLVLVPLTLAVYGLLRRQRIPLSEVIGRCDRSLPWGRAVTATALLVVTVMPLVMGLWKLWPGAIRGTITSTSHLTWTVVLMGAIVGPMGEEFIIRGLILNRLRQQHGAHRAIVWSAVLFALIHDPVRAVGAFPAGILFGLLYVRYQSLPLAVLAHAVVNIVALPMQGLGQVLCHLFPPVGAVISVALALVSLWWLLRLTLPMWRVISNAKLPVTGGRITHANSSS